MPGAVEPDDHALLGGIARGDGRALEQLVRRHSRWAGAMLMRVLGSRAVADDILQSCFVQLWEKPPAWQPQAQFRTWFYRVLHNRCLDHFRHQRRHTPLSSEEGEPPEDEPVLVTAGGQHTDAAGGGVQPGLEHTVLRRLDVQAALQALPERQRMAIVLVYFEELPQAEAAQLMALSVGALESLLGRARTALSKHLAAHRH
jgi:RNA polymerase sigma-70 factor (ECF subfamily)